jgi:hypothetical protein
MIPTKHVGLVQNRHQYNRIECNLFSLKVDHLALKQITHACIYGILIGKVAFNLKNE